MDKILEEKAVELATRCNQMVDDLGFDSDTDGVGFDGDGIFYSVTGCDAVRGLNEFFKWLKSEKETDKKAIRELQKEYKEYRKILKGDK